MFFFFSPGGGLDFVWMLWDLLTLVFCYSELWSMTIMIDHTLIKLLILFLHATHADYSSLALLLKDCLFLFSNVTPFLPLLMFFASLLPIYAGRKPFILQSGSFPRDQPATALWLLPGFAELGLFSRFNFINLLKT